MLVAEEKKTLLPELCMRNKNMLWGGVIAEVLARMGVRYAVIAPGSRSGPLTVGFGSHTEIEAIPILDERSAGFFALGLACRRKEPVVLICSSGTAAANFYPAVIEANLSHVPLIVLTADRPPEMRHCYAGQTIDQVKLYGQYPRWQAELALPKVEIEMLEYLRQTVVYACERAQSPTPGPVHLNVPFREPLAPVEEEGIDEYLERVDWDNFFDNIRKPISVLPQPERLQMEGLVEKLKAIKRGLIIVGPAQIEDAESFSVTVGYLAEKLGWPVLAEGLSPLRNFASDNGFLVTRYDCILRDSEVTEKLRPEGVLNIGALPTSKVLRSWLKGMDVPTWVVDPYFENRDGLHRKTCFLSMDVECLAEYFKPLSTTSSNGYCQAWLACEKASEAKISKKLKGCDFFFEGKIPWLLSRHLPKGTSLFIANSMPVRDVEFFWQRNNAGYVPYFSRGANGIDGTLSTALGVAHRGKPSVLLTGDLALLHDSNGFLINNHFEGSLTVIVINNNGGGIFENLPIARCESVFEKYFATPQAVSLEQLVVSHGIDFQSPKNWEDFGAMVRVLPESGMRVIEVVTDRKRDVKFRHEVFGAA